MNVLDANEKFADGDWLTPAYKAGWDWYVATGSHLRAMARHMPQIARQAAGDHGLRMHDGIESFVDGSEDARAEALMAQAEGGEQFMREKFAPRKFAPRKFAAGVNVGDIVHLDGGYTVPPFMVDDTFRVLELFVGGRGRHKAERVRVEVVADPSRNGWLDLDRLVPGPYVRDYSDTASPRRFDVGITDRLAALARVPAHLVDAAISIAVGTMGETSSNALAEWIEGKKSATGSHQVVDSLKSAYQGLRVILGREPTTQEYAQNVTGPLTAALQWLRVGYAEGGKPVRFGDWVTPLLRQIHTATNTDLVMELDQARRQIALDAAKLTNTPADRKKVFPNDPNEASLYDIVESYRRLVAGLESEVARRGLAGFADRSAAPQRFASATFADLKALEGGDFTAVPWETLQDLEAKGLIVDTVVGFQLTTSGHLALAAGTLQPGFSAGTKPARYSASARMPTSDDLRAIEAKGATLAFSDAPWNELAAGLTGDARDWVNRARAANASGSLSGARQCLREAERRAGDGAPKVKAFREAIKFFDPTNWPPTRDEALQVLRDAAANPDLAPGQRTVVANALATVEAGTVPEGALKKLLALGLKARHRGASLTDLAALTDYLAAGMFAFGETQRFAFGQTTAELRNRAYEASQAKNYALAADLYEQAIAAYSPDKVEMAAKFPGSSHAADLAGLRVLADRMRRNSEFVPYSADLPLWRFSMIADGEEYMTRDEWKAKRAAAGNPVLENPLGEFLSDAAELGVRWAGSGIVGVAKVGAALARVTGSTVAGIAAAPLQHAARVVKEALRGSRRDIDAAKELYDNGDMARALGVLGMPPSGWSEPSVLERSEHFGETPEKFAKASLSNLPVLPFFALWNLQEWAAGAIWDGLSYGARALVSSLSSALAGGADPEAVAQAAEADPELAVKLPARDARGRFMRAMSEGSEALRFGEALRDLETGIRRELPSAAADDLVAFVKRMPGLLWRQLTGGVAAGAALTAIGVPLPLALLVAQAPTLWANFVYTARKEQEDEGVGMPGIMGAFGEDWTPKPEFIEGAWAGELVSFEEKRRRLRAV